MTVFVVTRVDMYLSILSGSVVSSDPNATIEQLKVGLSQLARQNAQMASQVWQEIGNSVFQAQSNYPTVSTDSALSQQQQAPVTKEELERELAKVKLLTEQRLAEFFERGLLSTISQNATCNDASSTVKAYSSTKSHSEREQSLILH